jgi:hypothetical protein
MKTLLALIAAFALANPALAQYRGFGGGPKIIAPNGQYLRRLNANRFDPDSVANPYGRYGNPYGDTITNPYSRWGSPYSPDGVRNPYSTGGPFLLGDD